ncbi:DUF305 domain-containing protein [Arthrobacter sp.]|uniref:DUF305 domain-containing protein n=1 Tax=Arthrobacter sp. TaxID=1667 RepID=UPI002811B2DC|nr:DUF305 domain-containing protein [Arthrobacter sp.]
MNKNKNFSILSVTAVAAAIVLAGCANGGGSTSGSGASPAETAAAAASAAATTGAAAEHNEADTMFAQMMIPHHAQAVEMSDMILKKQDIPAEVTALATQIKAAQAPEIEKMAGWLKSWNESATPSAGAHSGHGSVGMSGMMSAEDMSKLDAARGTDAARLFLTQMIAHHEGAVMMAKTEESGGKNPEAIELSKTIIRAQEKEIQEMKDLLAKL